MPFAPLVTRLRRAAGLDVFLGGPMGGFPDGGGVKSGFVFKFCVGPKIVPKGPLGVGIGPFGLKIQRSHNPGAKKNTKTYQTFEKQFFLFFNTPPPSG